VWFDLLSAATGELLTAHMYAFVPGYTYIDNLELLVAEVVLLHAILPHVAPDQNFLPHYPWSLVSSCTYLVKAANTLYASMWQLLNERVVGVNECGSTLEEKRLLDQLVKVWKDGFRSWDEYPMAVKFL
jgi:hypothetical protein